MSLSMGRHTARLEYKTLPLEGYGEVGFQEGRTHQGGPNPKVVGWDGAGPTMGGQNSAPEGIFQGYASVYNVVDADGDIMRPGAFRGAVKDFMAGTGRPHLLWQHKTDELIGKITHMAEDDRGLKISAELLLEVQRGKEAYCLVKNGLIRGLSIGFIPILVTRDANQTRHILHVKLCEVSLVTMPANPMAHIHNVKGNDWVTG